jgi:hypothetical protein
MMTTKQIQQIAPDDMAAAHALLDQLRAAGYRASLHGPTPEPYPVHTPEERSWTAVLGKMGERGTSISGHGETVALAIREAALATLSAPVPAPAPL